jgi:uncharacterized OsmC-like protein
MDNLVLNGLNVAAIKDTFSAVGHDPRLATFTWRARNSWITGVQTKTTFDGYYGACEKHTRCEPLVALSDEPLVLLGTDKAPTPMEFLLHAMAGCFTTSLIAHATARGVEIEAVETTIVGDWDSRGFLDLGSAVHPGFEAIHGHLNVKGNTSSAILAELAEFARRRSPVIDVVTNGLSVLLDVRAQTTAKAK